jgi:hypothetical protein
LEWHWLLIISLSLFSGTLLTCWDNEKVNSNEDEK